jgi:AcrR family transcriptional regulator
VNRKIERGQATREELIDAATGLFAKRGYDATPIDAVLHAAGVSRGALYHHFEDKRALFEAALERVEAGVAREVVSSASSASDPFEALVAGCSAWLRLARDPVVRRISLIDAPAVVGWDRWREIDERHGFGLIKGALRALADEGRIEPGMVDVLAHMLLAALVEVALVIARADDAAKATRAGERAVRLLLESLLGPGR